MGSQFQVAAASINNGDTNITCSGATLLGNMVLGNMVNFDGENAFYFIGATPTDNVTIPITAPYAGPNKTNALLNVWRFFGPVTGDPLFNKGDNDWAFALPKWQMDMETIYSGYRASFQPCRVATTAALTGTYNSTSNQFTLTATGALSVDGVALSVNDRVLLKNQSTGTQNGLYYVLVAGAVGVSAVLARAADMYNTAIQGVTVWIMAGTANTLTQWYLATASPITINTSTITWTQVPFFGVPPLISGISATSLTIGTGSQSLTVPTGMSLSALMAVIIVKDASNYMEGFVTSYNSGTGALVVNVTAVTGSGTYSAWTVSLAGVVGAVGATGATGPAGSFTGPGSSASGNIVTFSDTTGAHGSDSGIAATSLAPKASPTLTGTATAANLGVTGEAYFGAEYSCGNSSTAITINFATNGNKQRVVINGNCTFTLTPPSGPANVVLRMIHDATGSAYTVTFSPVPKYAGGTVPTWTNTANAVDIWSAYWDGSNWWAAQGAAFA